MGAFRFALTAAALLLSIATGAHAQSTLRIGIAEDPDILDPSVGRTYVGRIVFSAFCDKLFDIDEKLNIVPQLALSYETSADGKEMTIRLRPGVKFHDGEPLDAEAAKFSIERHINLPTSFRKPELASVDHVEVVDAPAPTNSSNAGSRTASFSRNSPTTGTRTTSSSTASYSCRSSMPRYGLPI